MAQLVGWSRDTDGNNTYQLPAGSQVGDLAVLLVVSSSRYLRVRGGGAGSWAQAGSYSRRMMPGLIWVDDARYHVYTARIADLGDPVRTELGTTDGELMVVRGTTGVGRVRTGTGRVPVQALGGAVIAYMPSGAGDRPGGVSWHEPTIDIRLPFFGSRPTLLPGWVDVSSDGAVGPEANGAIALELLPPEGPGTPDILAPAAGNEAANTGEIDFEWRYRGAIPGGGQDAYQFRVVAPEGEFYWDASTGSLVGSQVTNVSSVEGVAVPAGVLPGQLEWQVRTRERVDGQWSGWSTPAGLVLVTPPSVSVTGPLDMAEDLSPAVEWSASTPRGLQTAFRVQIARLGQVLFDSGVIPGGASELAVPPREWVNGGLYQARVQVQQTGGSWSAWSTRDFTISWTEPAVPAVDVWPVRNGVLVQVAADPGLAVDLERITSQGLWERVGSFSMPGAGVALVSDVLAPYGQVTAYRARAVNELDGQRLTSDWGLSGQIANNDRYSYLAAAGDPLRTWVRVLIREDGTHTHQRPTAVAHGLGDTRPRVSYGPQRGRTGQLTLHALTQADRDHLVALLYAGEPLILRLPGEAAEEGPGWVEGGQLVFDVAGEIDVSRLTTGPLQRRTVTVPWVEQEPPVPGSGSNAPVTHPIGGPPGAAAQADNELELEAF